MTAAEFITFFTMYMYQIPFLCQLLFKIYQLGEIVTSAIPEESVVEHVTSISKKH